MRIGTRARRRSQGAVSLAMTSMIDATFLLLSYFLFTTAIHARESQLSADVTAVKAAPEHPGMIPQVVDVRADAAGTVYRIGALELRGRDELAAVMKRLSPAAGIIVRVHRGPDVAAVAAAVQVARDAGFGKVLYVAAPD